MRPNEREENLKELTDKLTSVMPFTFARMVAEKLYRQLTKVLDEADAFDEFGDYKCSAVRTALGMIINDRIGWD